MVKIPAWGPGSGQSAGDREFKSHRPHLQLSSRPWPLNVVLGYWSNERSGTLEIQGAARRQELPAMIRQRDEGESRHRPRMVPEDWIRLREVRDDAPEDCQDEPEAGHGVHPGRDRRAREGGQERELHLQHRQAPEELAGIERHADYEGDQDTKVPTDEGGEREASDAG